MPLLLLGLPLLFALVFLALKQRKIMNVIHVAGCLTIPAAACSVAWRVFSTGTIVDGYFYIDALGAWLIGLIAIVSFLAGIYSIGYFNHEIKAGEMQSQKLKWYYFWFYIFILTMFGVVVANNLGIMWIAIEGTTLASALLVGFYDNQASLEAAWKYIIICTVGIVFALFGIVLIYFAAIPVMGNGSEALNWNFLLQAAGQLDPKLVKLAFIFILVGYGTKVGLAPMHTWLPDAHSQAPSPVSAMMSGVLLNCALYGILRFHLVTVQAVGSGFSSVLLIIFGVLSVAVAIPFLIVQSDIKRLLAYSSIEHMGIMAAAIGIGGRLGLYGAFLHMLNHALAKTTLFFAAGNVTQHYHTKKMTKIRGVIKAMPITGPVLLMGILAIVGVPPFNIFLSEMAVFSAGFVQGQPIISCLLLLLVGLAFAGMIYSGTKMVFGAPSGRVERGEPGRLQVLMLILPLCFVLLLGIYIPEWLNNMLEQVLTVMGGK